MPEPLFRQEALHQQGERLWGELLLSQPLSYSIFTLFLGGITALALWFLVQHDYVRKQTVSGTLVPERGLIEVRAPAPGTLLTLHAGLDSRVEAGMPLFTLQLDHTLNGARGLTAQLLQEVALQARTLRAQEQDEIRRAATEAEHLQVRAAFLQRRLREQTQLVANEQTLLDLKQGALARAGELRVRGLLALADYEAVHAQLLQQKSVLGQLLLQQEQTRAEVAELDNDKAAAQLAHRRELQRLAAELAEVQKQQLRLGAEQTTAVLAPVSGRVTSVLRQDGMSVNAQEMILALMPEGALLEAELMLPSSAIGFVGAGQRVKLRYEAFPYQKFGVQQAVIRTVAASALPVTTGAGPMPAYRVLATLDQQSVLAYGAEQPLRPGMALSADVIVDERSLLEWLLEPLFSIRGKL
jgi:membrane fusion protein